MKRRGWVGLFVLPVLLLLAGWGWWAGVQVARKSRQELADLEARRQQLEEETRTLRREVVDLRQERWARERAAREVLPVVGPEEVLVVVPSPASEQSGNNDEGVT